MNKKEKEELDPKYKIEGGGKRISKEVRVIVVDSHKKINFPCIFCVKKVRQVL